MAYTDSLSLAEERDYWQCEAEHWRSVVQGPLWDQPAHHLTLTETRIMRAIARRPAGLLAEQLFRAMRDDTPSADSKWVDVYLCKLRKKLPEPIAPRKRHVGRAHQPIQVFDRAALLKFLGEAA